MLLHGGSGSWTHWARNIAALVRAGRQVWVPDLPGFGDSARPPGGGDADAVPAPLEDALQALLGDASVDLVGFSFGGMVAAFLAAQKPGAGSPAGPRRVRRRWASSRRSRSCCGPGAISSRARNWTRCSASNLRKLMLAKPESIDELALAIHAINLPRDRMKMRRISRTDILRRPCRRSRCPVYGIWGAEDALYRGVQEQLEPALRAGAAFPLAALDSRAPATGCSTRRPASSTTGRCRRRCRWYSVVG